MAAWPGWYTEAMIFKRTTAAGLAFTLALGIALPAGAQDANQPQRPADQLPSLVEAQMTADTVLLARIDLGRASMAAVAKLLEGVRDEMPADERDAVQSLVDEQLRGLAMIDRQREHLLTAGASEMYLMLPTSAVLGNGRAELIVPTANEASATAVTMAMLQNEGVPDDVVEIRPGGVVVTLGEPRDANEPRMQYDPRAGQRFAPSFSGEHAMQVIVVPNLAMRTGMAVAFSQTARELNQIREQMATMPDLAGGLVAASQFERIVLSVDTDEPGVDLLATFGGETPPAKIEDTADALRVWLGQGGDDQFPGDTADQLSQMLSMADFKAEGKQFTAELDEQGLHRALRPMLLTLKAAQDSANVVKSGSNLRQMSTAVHMYAQKNQGKLPVSNDEFEAMLADFFHVQADRVRYNPVTKQSDGYAFGLSGKLLADLKPDEVLGYEKVPAGDPQRQVLIAFIDGSVRAKTLGELEAFSAEQGFDIEYLEK